MEWQETPQHLIDPGLRTESLGVVEAVELARWAESVGQTTEDEAVPRMMETESES
jgi:hypothetical protein